MGRVFGIAAMLALLGTGPSAAQMSALDASPAPGAERHRPWARSISHRRSVARVFHWAQASFSPEGSVPLRSGQSIAPRAAQA